ncbi:MAG TPA: enoyl-CoA hydratase [Aestuariivirgaceae bacterium]
MSAVEEHRSDQHIVLSEHDGGLLRLTLNNPDRRNALSEDMLTRLQEEIDTAGASEDVKCIIIAARGPVFSSGHDLKQLSSHRSDRDGGRGYFTTVIGQCSQLMQSIVLLPKPVIAEVRGLASAAGLQLAASCDMVMAARSARFCTPGVNIGLFCSTPMVALTRVVQPRHAMEMLFTGDVFSAEDAYRFGLVNRIVPDNQLSEATEELARKLMSRSLEAINIGKRAFAAQQRLSLDHAYAHCNKVMVDNLMNEDADEGIGAFLEKRPPRWRGK